MNSLSPAARFEESGLQFEIGFDEERKTVIVRAEGDLNAESCLHLAQRYAQAAVQSRATRVLLDVTAARFTDSVLGIYEYPARLLEQKGIPRALRIAVVYETDEQKHRFWETVFRNRGFLARVFRNAGNAFDWLTGRQRT